MTKYIRMAFCLAGLGAFLGLSLFARKFDELPNSEHIEPLLTSNRPPFMAPVGCANVALNKKVTASTNGDFGGSLEQITDGIKGYEQDQKVTFGRWIKWIQIDLEQPRELYAIAIWRDFADPFKIYRGMIVQAADDPNFTTNVRTLFNNDWENLNGLGKGTDLEYAETFEGKLIDAHGIKARYLRFYCQGNHSDKYNDYTEIETWGLPVSEKDSTNSPPRQLAPLPIKLPQAPVI
jgi:hypothetical protein